MVALRHMRDPSPAVRREVGLLAYLAAYGRPAVEGAVHSFVDAIVAEQDEKVIGTWVLMLRPLLEKEHRIRDALIGWLDHPSADVRIEAVLALGVHDTAVLVDRFYDKMLDKLVSDPDPRVRGVACSHLSSTGNIAAIPQIEARLSDPTTPQPILHGCFPGLINAWLAAHDPSPTAYELTLKLLERRPRAPLMPPNRGLELFRWFSSNSARTQKLMPFFEKPRVVAAFRSCHRPEGGPADPIRGAASPRRAR